jgi:hypothetical protein
MSTLDNLLSEAINDKLISIDISLLRSNKNVRLKNDDSFLTYAKRNQWADRRNRDNPLPWRSDVFDFILLVYDRWLGRGLLQGDIKVADPSLYAELQKKLSALRREGKLVPAWIERDIPKERSSQALKFEITDEKEREKILHHRELERERMATSRARQQRPSP